MSGPGSSCVLEARPTIRVLISSPLEAEYAERIRAVDRRLEVIYRPDLVGHPRYVADHHGDLVRTEAQQREWQTLLQATEVLFDFDSHDLYDLPRRAPRLRWIQATSSGVGQLIVQIGLVDSHIVVTNAAGVHAVPLAEFVLTAMLMFTRQISGVLERQRSHRWEKVTTPELTDRLVVLVGLGHVGSEIARRAKAFGMRVCASKRQLDGRTPEDFGVDELFPLGRLRDVLPRADFVVLTVPHTPETERIIAEPELMAMKPTAILINVARGAIVDEAALIGALRAGRIGGAALDVFEREPLPPDSPLWDMPNVLVTSHTMANSQQENDRLTSLFCENLRRYLDGRPLLNAVDKRRGY